MLDQTLEQLEGTEWGEPEYGSSVVLNCHRLRRIPLKDFTVEDLRLMIGQREGLAYLVPLALEQLERDPMVSGDYCEGDLLQNVQRLPAKFWEQHPVLGERWRLVQVAVAALPPPHDRIERHKESPDTKAEKTFDCVGMKRRGAKEVQKTLAGMTPEEELAFWQNGMEELRQEQSRARAERSDAGEQRTP